LKKSLNRYIKGRNCIGNREGISPGYLKETQTQVSSISLLMAKGEKNIIRSLEGASGEISNQAGLEEHIIYFYKELVGDRAHVEGSASLQPSGQTENDFLLRIVIILSNLSRRRK